MTFRRARKKTSVVLLGLCLLVLPMLQAARAMEAPATPAISLCDQAPADGALCDCCGTGADPADSRLCHGLCSAAYVVPAALDVGPAPEAWVRTPRPPGNGHVRDAALPEPDPPKRPVLI